MTSVLEILPAFVSLTALEFRCVSRRPSSFISNFFPLSFCALCSVLAPQRGGYGTGGVVRARSTSCNQPPAFTLVVFIFRIRLRSVPGPLNYQLNYLLFFSYLARHRRMKLTSDSTTPHFNFFLFSFFLFAARATR
jgi:hypothetical protein